MAWTPRARRPRLTIVLTVLAALTTACGGDSSPAEVQVFASSSLTDAFREIGEGFENEYGIRPRLTFAGSQVLRLQIEQGAPADVFASADSIHMRALLSSGLVTRSVSFATNRLALIVPESNPEGVRTLSDLARVDRFIVGSPGVPIGRYTRSLLDAAEGLQGPGFRDMVLGRAVSEETNVRLIRAKVQLGEASAAFVYESDAGTDTGVRTIPLPNEVRVHATYQAGPVAGGPNADAASLWLAWLTSEAGLEVLRRHGFSAP